MNLKMVTVREVILSQFGLVLFYIFLHTYVLQNDYTFLHISIINRYFVVDIFKHFLHIVAYFSIHIKKFESRIHTLSRASYIAGRNQFYDQIAKASHLKI